MNKSLDREGLLKALLGLGNDKGIWRAALLLLLIVSALGVVQDINDTAEFGQIDLRNRVVGARAMVLGHNPYTYRWRPGDPTTLLDPYFGPGGDISGVTVTPVVLAGHAVFAGVHYRYQKFIWLFVQLGLFGGMVWVAIQRAGDPETKAAVLLAGVMFSCSTFWRVHVDRGQVYVLFSFLAVLFIASFAWRSRHRGAWGGFILGLLVCLRPQMALLALPFLIYRKLDCLLGAVAGVALGLLSPLAVSQTAWVDYTHAMINYVHPAPRAAGPNEVSAPAPRVVAPAEAEGMTNLAGLGFFGYLDSSLKNTLRYLHLPTPALLFLGLLATGIGAWSFSIYRLMRQGAPLDFCTAKTLGLVLLVELVLPIRRALYSDMILVAIVLTIFATRPRISALRTWEWALLLTAWIFSAPFPPWVSAAFRSAVVGVMVPYAILLWAWFTPWRLPSGTDGTPARPEAAPRANR